MDEVEREVIRGMFSVPEGTRGGTLRKATVEATRRFLDHYVKLGWTLDGKPLVRKIPSAKGGFRPVVDKAGSATLWVPTSTGMRSDHPFYQPGMLQFVVSAPFHRPARLVKLEIADSKLQRLIDKGTLPKGVKIEG